MRATGIVRKADELGRITLPKELRRTLGINEGTPIEIYTDNDGSIILKKYDPIPDIESELERLSGLIEDVDAKQRAKVLLHIKGIKELLSDGK